MKTALDSRINKIGGLALPPFRLRDTRMRPVGGKSFAKTLQESGANSPNPPQNMSEVRLGPVLLRGLLFGVGFAVGALLFKYAKGRLNGH